MAGQENEKRKGQSTLTFQQCLIFPVFVFNISSLFDPV